MCTCTQQRYNASGGSVTYTQLCGCRTTPVAKLVRSTHAAPAPRDGSNCCQTTMVWDSSPDLGSSRTRQTDGQRDHLTHTTCMHRPLEPRLPQGLRRPARIHPSAHMQAAAPSAALAQPRRSSRRASGENTHARGRDTTPGAGLHSSPASSSSRDGSSAGLGSDGTYSQPRRGPLKVCHRGESVAHLATRG